MAVAASNRHKSISSPHCALRFIKNTSVSLDLTWIPENDRETFLTKEGKARLTLGGKRHVSGKFSYAADAEGFERTFSTPMRAFVPALLRLSHIAPGNKVLDIATGTGMSAEDVLHIVGATGHVAAADNAPAMLDKAQERLNGYANVSISTENAEHLSFPDQSFDAVVCCMALMVFNDCSQALTEFLRVLRPGGRVAVSVNTVPERTLTGPVRLLIQKHVPSKAKAIAAYMRNHYSLGATEVLSGLLGRAGFDTIETLIEVRKFEYPSFDDYFNTYDRGIGPWGIEFQELPEGIRRSIRNERRHEMGASNGSHVCQEVEILFGSGRKPV
jgi:SAM-dependent methyltransferase